MSGSASKGDTQQSPAVEVRVGTLDATRRIEVTPLPSLPPRDRVAAHLSYMLVGMLSGVIVLHYLCIIIVSYCNTTYDKEVATSLDQLFNKVLPVIAGLAGSASTYFLTRDNVQAPTTDAKR